MKRWLSVLAFALLACEQKDPIAVTIESMVQAAEERDAGDVMQHLASGYSGANGGRAETEQMLRRYFVAYDSIDVDVQGLETTRSGTQATAVFRVRFNGVPKTAGGMDQFLPRSAAYRFHLSLAQEGGRWKIATAHWEEDAGP